MVDSKMNENYNIDTDFHSHILPCIDDGSPDIRVTEDMLRMEAGQGIRTVIATPHFYASRMSVKSFAERRKHAYEKTLDLIRKNQDLPQVIPAAEVFFFPGIGRADLRSLCAAGSRVLFLEMPFRQWTEEDLLEVRQLSVTAGYHVVLVHLERFLPYQRKKEAMEDVLKLPVTIQFNAGCLARFSGRRSVRKILDTGLPVVMGSDCHNTGRRRPDMEDGIRILGGKFGLDAAGRIARSGCELLDRILEDGAKGGMA